MKSIYTEQKKMGIRIFLSVGEAIRAGYIIESAIPDHEGLLHARIHTSAGWALAVVRIK